MDVHLSAGNDTHGVFWKLREDGSYRVLLYSPSNQPLSCSDSELITISIENGDYQKSIGGQLYNIVAATPSARVVKLQNKEIGIRDEVTRVVTRTFDEDNHRGNIYDMLGKLIKESATSSDIKRLPQGMYIINGKKIVVR